MSDNESRIEIFCFFKVFTLTATISATTTNWKITSTTKTATRTSSTITTATTTTKTTATKINKKQGSGLTVSLLVKKIGQLDTLYRHNWDPN